MNWVLLVGGVGLLVACVVLLLVRRSKQRRLAALKRAEPATVRDLTALARSVGGELGEAGRFAQPAEVRGLIRCDSPLTSEIAGQPCVYYQATVTRDYEETYYETDSSGRREAKTRRGSDTVASNSQRVPFWVEDATGRIQVDPNGASVDAVAIAERYEAGSPVSLGISVGGLEIGLGGAPLGPGRRALGYRYRESALPLDRQVYVLGEASDASGELAIRAPSQGGTFIISLKSKEELIRSTGRAVLWLLISAVAAGVLGAGLLVARLLR